jgi:transcriptional regulator with XRE-family HTH domain
MKKSSKKPHEAVTQAILDEMPQEITGKHLSDGREKLGFTQEQMAKLFRVTLNTYSRWERDRFLPHASGAIWLALEQLIFKQSLRDLEELLRDLEQRLADSEATTKRLLREREQFERSLNNNK